LALFTPLTATVKFTQRERSFASAALAFDFRQPPVRSGAKPGNVGRHDVATSKGNETLSALVALDFVGLDFHDGNKLASEMGLVKNFSKLFFGE
jgi:hypothetical protein